MVDLAARSRFRFDPIIDRIEDADRGASSITLPNVYDPASLFEADVMNPRGLGYQATLHGGNDIAFGGNGNDVLIDGDSLSRSGRMRMSFTSGDDTLNGGEGNDRFVAGGGNNMLNGGWGEDTVSYENARSGATVDLQLGTGDADYRSGHGHDTLSGIENVTGTGFADRISGDHLDNKLSGGGGDDNLFGNGGIDILNGGAGNDILDGGAGIDTATFINATQAVQVDLANGRATGDGIDTLINMENVTGSFFGDSIMGDRGNNELSGLWGNDTLNGGRGDDVLNGGAGADVLTGGVGKDVYTYQSASESNAAGMDTITDFHHGTDKIDVTGLGNNANITWSYDAELNQTIVDVAPAAGGDHLEIALTGNVQLDMNDFNYTHVA